MGIAVAMSFSFFANYDYFQNIFKDILWGRYPDPEKLVSAVIYYEETGEWPDGFGDASASSFFGKVLLWLSEWVMLALCIGIPVLTWKIASASIHNYERRKIESN